MSWTDSLREANRPGLNGKVVLAHLHGPDVSQSFQASLAETTLHDQTFAQHLFHPNPDGSVRYGYISVASGAGRIADGRNQAVDRFLRLFPDGEWLLFVDSDMGFDPEALNILVASADATTRPVVGGLCFAAKFAGHGPQHAQLVDWVPTIYVQSPTGAYSPCWDYPPDSLVEVAATGAAFLLIHRSVLEKIGSGWFDNLEAVDGNGWMGEDFSFCRRAREAGFSLWVNTAAKTSHNKSVWFTDDDYRDLRQTSSEAVTVVIPVKDRLDLTRQLVGQLVAQGGYSDILIFDNGSEDPEMVEWLRTQQAASVFDAKGAGIHDMWNAGIAEAVHRHGGRADVVLLNNDLVLGHRFLRRLIRGLRSDPGLMMVSGNYDQRPGSGVQPVRGICAGRYDGTGGLAGFAFAMRAEWVAAYRFPTDLSWYFGDNDVCLSVEQAGGWYGIVSDARVTHVDGGGNTTGALVGPTYEQDREAFEARWPDVTVSAA